MQEKIGIEIKPNFRGKQGVIEGRIKRNWQRIWKKCITVWLKISEITLAAIQIKCPRTIEKKHPSAT